MLVSMSKIKINFHLSLGYYILWNPSIGMAKRILAHNSKNQNFARYGIGGKISITILVFTLDYLQEKLLTKFFKRPKKPYFRTILGLLYSNLGQKWIFLEKRALSVFKYSTYLKKLFTHSWEKCQTDIRREGQTGRHYCCDKKRRLILLLYSIFFRSSLDKISKLWIIV